MPILLEICSTIFIFLRCCFSRKPDGVQLSTDPSYNIAFSLEHVGLLWRSTKHIGNDEHRDQIVLFFGV
jgi:hypothetical protein